MYFIIRSKSSHDPLFFTKATIHPKGAKHHPAIAKPFPDTNKSLPAAAKPLPDTDKHLLGHVINLPDSAKHLPGAAKPFPEVAKAFPEAAKPFPDSAKPLRTSAIAFPGAAKAFRGAAKPLRSRAKALPAVAKPSHGSNQTILLVKSRSKKQSKAPEAKSKTYPAKRQEANTPAKNTGKRYKTKHSTPNSSAIGARCNTLAQTPKN